MSAIGSPPAEIGHLRAFFLLVAVTIGLVALEALALPELFASPAYDTLRPYLGIFGGFSLAAAVGASAMASGRLTGLGIAGGLLLAGLPAAVLASASVSTGSPIGAWAWIVLTTTSLGLGVALLTGRAPRWQPAPVAIGLVLAGNGALMLASPGLFSRAVYGELVDALLPFGAVLVASGAGVVAGEAFGRRGLALAAVALAEIGLVGLITTYIATGLWVGVALHWMLALVLMVALLREVTLHRAAIAQLALFVGLGAWGLASHLRGQPATDPDAPWVHAAIVALAGAWLLAEARPKALWRAHALAGVALVLAVAGAVLQWGTPGGADGIASSVILPIDTVLLLVVLAAVFVVRTYLPESGVVHVVHTTAITAAGVLALVHLLVMTIIAGASPLRPLLHLEQDLAFLLLGLAVSLGFLEWQRGASGPIQQRIYGAAGSALATVSIAAVVSQRALKALAVPSNGAFESELLAVTDRLLVLLLTVLVLTLIGTAAVISGQIVRPIEQLVGVARRRAAGDRSARANLRRADEFGVLGSALDAAFVAEDAADEALARSRRQLEIVIANAPVILFAMDREGVLTLSEGAGLAALGLRPGEVVGQSAFALYADVPDAGVGIRHALAGETARVLVRGRGLAFDARYVPLRDATGTITGVTGVALDVTEHERATERLRLLESAVVHTAEAVVVTDAQMDGPGPMILYVNPAYERMTGRSLAELVGRSPRIVQGPGTDAAVRARMRRAFSEGQEFRGENVNYRRDGTPYQVEIHVTPIRDAHGVVTNFVSVERDISERQALEEQLARARRFESLGQLAGGIAHDFNNLLAVILNYARFAAHEAGDSAVGRDIGEVVSAAERAASLTHQLLTISRHEVVRAAVIDLNAVVQDAKAMLTRALGEHVDLRVDLDPAGAFALLDRGHIEQVLMNLVLNARDAMPTGGVLTIETARVELDEHQAARRAGLRPGPHVRLRVRDTGTGMPAEVIARAFDPFFTTKTRGVGTGLGLSIVHGIVASAAGSAELSSRKTEPGRGTVVEILLPAAGEAAAASPVRPVEAPETRGSETVLVVEDDLGVRRVAERILVGAGYRALVAASLADAFAFANSDAPIDLLLSDVIMPGRSGPELAADLVARRPGLKVLFMSGYPEDHVARAGVASLGAALVEKPFTDESLLRSVRAVLDG